MDNIKKLFNTISKLGIYLTKTYETFTEEKKSFMNHPKVVEYLFNKPIIKIYSTKDILSDYDNIIRPIPLGGRKANVASGLFVMLEMLERYTISCEQYENCIKKYIAATNRKPNFIKIRYLPLISELSNNEKLILKTLSRLEDKYELEYIYKWSFVSEGEHLNLSSKIPIKYSQEFVYDFYGISTYNDKLTQFVIEYSRENLAGEHVIDVMKQYMLYQMNVHLLRLTRESDIKTEIKNFIKKIINTKEYVIVNGIKPISKLFIGRTNDELVRFYDDYQYNHIAYLKNPKRNEIYEVKVDEVDNEIISYKPYDEKSSVSNDVFNKLVNKKIYFTSGFNDKMIENIWRDREKNEVDLIEVFLMKTQK